MNKLKHTKKTDFQDTLNLDSKSQLAKLLATENITVQHNNVATASFDVANRVLTLPIFKIKNLMTQNQKYQVQVWWIMLMQKIKILGSKI